MWLDGLLRAPGARQVQALTQHPEQEGSPSTGSGRSGATLLQRSKSHQGTEGSAPSMWGGLGTSSM